MKGFRRFCMNLVDSIFPPINFRELSGFEIVELMRLAAERREHERAPDRGTETLPGVSRAPGVDSTPTNRNVASR